jgi:hypothetical protein
MVPGSQTKEAAMTRLTIPGILGSALAATAVSTSSFAAEAQHAMGDWWEALDHYCERVGTGFWAEPFNAFSNAAFLIAASAILIRQRKAGWNDRPLIVLALMTASVGIGSFLFHTFANRWSLIADMLPIAVLIYSFFFVALHRFLHVGAIAAGLSTVTLFLLSPQLEMLLKPILGGSAAYTPGLIATFGVAVAVPILGRGPIPCLLLAAGAAFSIALLFRVLDAPLCGSWPTGTHFLWHTFNGLALGLALLAAERVWPARATAGRTLLPAAA